MNTNLQSERNFGVFTDMSKGLNWLLGDSTGRTISLRTAHGIKNSFGLTIMSDLRAEKIAHGLMIASFAGLASQAYWKKTLGVTGVVILIIFYQMGKPFPTRIQVDNYQSRNSFPLN